MSKLDDLKKLRDVIGDAIGTSGFSGDKRLIEYNSTRYTLTRETYDTLRSLGGIRLKEKFGTQKQMNSNYGLFGSGVSFDFDLEKHFQAYGVKLDEKDWSARL